MLKMNKDKDSRACFQIGAKKGAPQKKYYLKFNHSDTGEDSTYIDVPLLEADLDTTPVTINFVSSVECVKGGSSFPITFDVGKYPPLEQVTIKLTTSNESPQISPTTTSSLVLQLGNDAGQVTFQCSATSTTETFTITLEGNSANGYMLGTSTLTVTAKDAKGGDATVAITPDPAQASAILYKPSVTCSDYSTVYWWLSNSMNKEVPTLEVVKGKVSGGYDVDPTDPMRVNYGFTSTQGGSPQELSVTVQANVNYQFVAWCELLSGSQQPSANITFKSKNNEGVTTAIMITPL